MPKFSRIANLMIKKIESDVELFDELDDDKMLHVLVMSMQWRETCEEHRHLYMHDMSKFYHKIGERLMDKYCTKMNVNVNDGYNRALSVITKNKKMLDTEGSCKIYPLCETVGLFKWDI